MNAVMKIDDRPVNKINHRLLPAILLGSVLALSVTGCGEPPKVMPQGTVEQQGEDVRAAMNHVLQALAAGQSQNLMSEGVIFLPSRWRRQQKEFIELQELQAALKERQQIVPGEVHVLGRWALLDGVTADGQVVGQPGQPWFMLYFSGQWRWLPSTIMRDPAIEGMMDRHFDQLWATWQATHPAGQGVATRP